jgi:hypothetical protein
MFYELAVESIKTRAIGSNGFDLAVDRPGFLDHIEQAVLDPVCSFEAAAH